MPPFLRIKRDKGEVYCDTNPVSNHVDFLILQTTKTLNLNSPSGITLEELIELLREKPEYQMKNPGITTIVEGKNKTLYLPQVASIEQATRPNLSKSLEELKLVEGTEILVADVTSPSTIVFRLHYENNQHMDVEMR